MWKDIYDRWLKEGDLKVLMYLQKIQRYLDHGRMKTKQEQDNLMAQINALLDLTYHGQYRRFKVKKQISADVIVDIMHPNIPVALPDLLDREAIALFLSNPDNIRIKPQPVDQFKTHPLWILWGTLTGGTESERYRTALWIYQRIFLTYMADKDYVGAATIFMYAQSIKIREEPLPLLHPYVIGRIMS